MKQYIVVPVDDTPRGPRSGLEVKWCVSEVKEPDLVPVAYCPTSDVAARIARLLNDEEWRRKLAERD